MKYIDAERLKVEIERFSATEYGDNTFGDDIANGALDYVLEEIIPSIQQEQQEVDLEKELVSICKTYGITEHLDAELGPLDIRNIAHHFYELGLNARK